MFIFFRTRSWGIFGNQGLEGFKVEAKFECSKKMQYQKVTVFCCFSHSEDVNKLFSLTFLRYTISEPEYKRPIFLFLKKLHCDFNSGRVTMLSTQSDPKGPNWTPFWRSQLKEKRSYETPKRRRHISCGHSVRGT